MLCRYSILGIRYRTLVNQSGVNDVGQPWSYTKSCQDVTQKAPFKVPNPLTIQYRFQEGSLKVAPQGTGIIPLSSLTQGRKGGFAKEATYINRVLSQTGPLTPNLYLPVSFIELREIPMMLRHAGDLLHKISRPHKLDPVAEAAAGTLAYQFGWKPLIQDIGKLIDFADVVKKRQRILRSAHSTDGVRRRVHLDEQTGAEGSYLGFISHHLSPSYTKVTPYKDHRKWATVRWVVKDKSQIGKEPSFNEAFKTAFGLNRGHIPIEIWKAMPWTWAIDWFADISNILAANYNMIYYSPGPISMMTLYQTKYVVDPITTMDPLRRYEGGTITLVEKFRTIHSPNTSITLKLPFLDSFKLSIVGSMTVLRIKGSH